MTTNRFNVRRMFVLAFVTLLCNPNALWAAPEACERAAQMKSRAAELRAQIEKTYVIGNSELIDIQTKLAESYERTEKENTERCATEMALAKLPPPKVGMSSKTVREKTNMGAPKSINTTVTAHGTQEQWVYADHVYLYFSNGKLTSMQY